MNTGSKTTMRKSFILLLLLLVAASFLAMIQSFLVTLLMAAIFTALLMPLYKKVTLVFRGRESLSAIFILIFSVLAIGLPLIGMLGVVASEALQISKQVTPWVSEQMQGDSPLAAKLPEWVPFAERLEPYRESILEKLGEVVRVAGTFLVNGIPSITQGTITLLLNSFILLYAMFVFLLHGSTFLHTLKGYIPVEREDLDLIVNRGFAVTRASLKGILIIGLLQGFLIAIAFGIIGIKGAAFWGALVVILSAIPGLGAPIIWVPAAIYLFVTNQVAAGIGLSIWGGVVVGLIDNVLRPTLVGRDAKLPDLLILISILGGIGMFGAAGILIGPIITAILVTLLGIYQQMFKSELQSSLETIALPSNEMPNTPPQNMREPENSASKTDI